MKRRDGGRSVEPVEDQLAALTYAELTQVSDTLSGQLRRHILWAYSGFGSAAVGFAAYAAWCVTDQSVWAPVWLTATAWTLLVPWWAERRSTTLGAAHTAVHRECMARLAMARQRQDDEWALIHRQLACRDARLRGETHPADEWVREWEGRLR